MYVKDTFDAIFRLHLDPEVTIVLQERNIQMCSSEPS